MIAILTPPQSPARPTAQRLRLCEPKESATAREARYAENLVARWHAADPEWLARGAFWYAEAQHLVTTMARQASCPVDTVTAIAAVLTANSAWFLTVRGVGRALALWRRGEPMDSGVHRYGQYQAKVAALLGGADPAMVISQWTGKESNSYKTREMYHCLSGDLGHTVVDRHHWRFCQGDPDLPARVPQGKQYGEAVRGTERAAAVLGLLPGDLQQRLWVEHLKERAYCGHIA